MEREFQYVGRVKAIYRYPVKSMQAEPLERAAISWHGIEGDRRYAFVKTGNPSSFPWLTGREVPEMVRYRPRFTNPANVRESPVRVTTPAGRDLAVDGPELLEELASAWGSPAHLIHLGTGCYDAMPLSFLSTASLDALGGEAGLALDPRRFRPNVLVELADGAPFGEDGWIGSTIQIGEGAGAACAQINRRDRRCVMTNIDPDTAQRDPRVLKALVRLRDECIAVYGSTQRAGEIRVGDPIYQWTF